MEELKQQLTKELQQDFNVKILDSLSWGLPVHSIEIEYHTVKRSKMDVLMKMMLIAFQKAEIETAEELSEILLVEQLFINDLINKMFRSRLIEKKGSTYALTDAGGQQLENGVFEGEPVKGTKEAIYSLCHHTFLTGEIKEVTYEGLKVYRFRNEFDEFKINSIGENVLLNTLKETGVESDEGNVQTVVSEIVSSTELQINLVPCQEFRLHNLAEDIIYARVWNTLTEQWDETLEAQVNKKDRIDWRKMYLQNA